MCHLQEWHFLICGDGVCWFRKVPSAPKNRSAFQEKSNLQPVAAQTRAKPPKGGAGPAKGKSKVSKTKASPSIAKIHSKQC